MSALSPWEVMLTETCPGVEERQERVIAGGQVRRRLLLPGGSLPVLVVRLGHDVSGLAERRDPLAVFTDGVPAHVVEVQVGADDKIYVVAPETGRGEGLDEGSLVRQAGIGLR